MDVVVFGAGSLGSLVGGVLARTHDVTLIGRDPHVSTIAAEGLRVRGAVEATVTPAARTALRGHDDGFDLVVVTVKSYDTAAARDALAAAGLGNADVLSLSNGLGNETVLAERLPRVLAGTCTYGARLVEPGVVECTGLGEVVLGAPEGGTAADADRVGEAVADAGLAVVVADDMPRRLWEKLAVNAGLNAVTALARIENGALRDGPANDVARAAAREVAACARDHGVDLADEVADAALERVADATAPNRSSMLQDVDRGRRTEVDSINGYVADSDTPSPVNDVLAGLLRAWESGQGHR